MIERFNFYDVYGYLIPGVVMVTLLLLPYGLTTSRWPDAQFGSIAVVLVAAYVVGHFIQGMASAALPVKVAKDRYGHFGLPSVLLLNPSNPALGAPLRRRIVELVKARFKVYLDVTTDVNVQNELHDDIARARNNVFYLCRPVVNKASSYGEQYQGLYVLMRGLFVVLLLVFCYYVGWLVWFADLAGTGHVFRTLFTASLVVSVALSVWRAFDDAKYYEAIDPTALSVLALVFLAAGEIAAEMANPTSATSWQVLAALAAFFLVLAFRFLVLYRYFAIEFAKAIWTYFAATEAGNAEGASSG